MSPNLRAFLDMIAYSELGPDILAQSDDGYNVLVGSTPDDVHLFDSYADHPRQLITLMIKARDGTHMEVQSTAAGRYQILMRYFDVYRMQLGLPDFGHNPQDLIAVQMIRECKAVNDIEAGRFDDAVAKCASRWASLPKAGYGQHENDLTDLRTAFVAAGGALA